MASLNFEEFLDIYAASILKAVPWERYRSLEDFYMSAFRDISKATGLSLEQVKYFHHAFHWALFSWENPVLQIRSSKQNGETVSLKDGKEMPDRPSLVLKVLDQNRPWLEKRFETVMAQLSSSD